MKALISIFIIFLLTSGCKKFIEVEAPVTSFNADNIYTNDATAAAVLTGIYTNMSSASIVSGGSILGMSFFPALSADELKLNTGVSNAKYVRFYRNTLNNSDGDFWNIIYPMIFTINSAIEGLNKSSSLTPAIKQQLLGEALFMRAFCYFYLVNLYGDVPLVWSTDWTLNSSLNRISKQEIYSQIVEDLKMSKNLLNSNFLGSDVRSVSSERVRPTKWVAIALLARVYLYIGDFVNAEIEASGLLDNNTLFSLCPLGDVFKSNSKEAIWQLKPVTTSPSNTWEGFLFVLPAAGPNTSTYPVYLSNYVLNSFETGDDRKVNWVKSVSVGPNIYSYPNKYKIGRGNAALSEYSTIFRLAELYLIRSEARIQQNKIGGAQDDLNIIRKRANLPSTSANGKNSIIAAIYQERKVELFTEWGHRWFDLKRSGNVNSVMTLVTNEKGGIWNLNWQWYPIPQYELEKDPNIIQNDGY